jgi:hypothetical protein
MLKELINITFSHRNNTYLIFVIVHLKDSRLIIKKKIKYFVADSMTSFTVGLIKIPEISRGQIIILEILRGQFAIFGNLLGQFGNF